MTTPIMTRDDEIANLRAENARLRQELESMHARHPENACADTFPKLRGEMREVVGELRIMRDFIQDGAPTAACNRVLELLRRLDETQ